MEEEEVTPGSRLGPGSTLPGSVLPPLPVLRCGSVEGAGLVGRNLRGIIPWEGVEAGTGGGTRVLPSPSPGLG